MARSHDRGRRGEQRVEKITGAKRVKHRPRFAKMGDFWPLRLEQSGETLQFESKAGENAVPKTVLKDIGQARSYAPNAVPIAVYSNVGGESIACLPLEDLARLLGIGPEQEHDGQLSLSTPMKNAVDEAKAKGWPERLPPIGLVGVARKHDVDAEELAELVRRTG